MKRSELRQIIKEEIQKLTESKAEAGFDLTDITASNWKKLLKKYNIPTKPREVNDRWVWQAKDRSVTIYTTNDPITGKYSVFHPSWPDRRLKEDEKDYAGSIGITGDKDKVSGIFGFIKKHAHDIKGDDPNARHWI